MTGDRLQTSCGSLAIVRPAISLFAGFCFHSLHAQNEAEMAVATKNIFSTCAIEIRRWKTEGEDGTNGIARCGEFGWIEVVESRKTVTRSLLALVFFSDSRIKLPGIFDQQEANQMSANIIENRVTALEQRVDSIERQQNELKQFERTLIKRDLFLATIQIIAMVLAIFGAGSYLSYQNSKLIEQIDKRIEDSNRQMDKRFEQMEKRFEDLKQVVLSDRQQRERR